MNLFLLLTIVTQIALGVSGMAAAAGAGGPGGSSHSESLLSRPARDKDMLKAQRESYLSEHPEIRVELREDIAYGRCSENSYDYLCSNPEMMELVECVIIASAKFMARVASNVAMLAHIQGVCIYGGMLSMDFIEALQDWPLVSLRISSCKNVGLLLKSSLSKTLEELTIEYPQNSSLYAVPHLDLPKLRVLRLVRCNHIDLRAGLPMNLETLNIVSCEQVIFPVWVPESLKHLDFHALDIKGLPDFVFGSSLDSIYLCACEQFSDLPESLPETITALSFSCGRLKRVPPFVSFLPRLRKLELWGNKPKLEPCEVLNASGETVAVKWEARYAESEGDSD